LKIVEIDFEENQQLVADLKTVRVFLTLILNHKGKVVFKKEGFGNFKNDLDVALLQNN
jgi:hypothetical protein